MNRIISAMYNKLLDQGYYKGYIMALTMRITSLSGTLEHMFRYVPMQVLLPKVISIGDGSNTGVAFDLFHAGSRNHVVLN